VIASSIPATALFCAASMTTGLVANGPTASRYAVSLVTRFLAQAAVRPSGASTQPRINSTIDVIRQTRAWGPCSSARRNPDAAPLSGAGAGSRGSEAVAVETGAVGRSGASAAGWTGGSGSVGGVPLGVSDMSRTSEMVLLVLL